MTTADNEKNKRNASPLPSPSAFIQRLNSYSKHGFDIPDHIRVKFAPINVPRHRRLQTAAVATWALILPISFSLFLLCLSFPPIWPILIPYLIWAFLIDNAPEDGGRARKWFRDSRIWKFFAEYYPVSMVKEDELPSDKAYVFGYHPHGIIGMGALANFATNATGFSSLFPNINPHLLTLTANFQVPFYRDLLQSMGICSVTKRSCERILRKGPGNAITIVVGGAAESLNAHPGTSDLILKKRLGFIKIAIREGANLVPVFSFGENDIYQQLATEDGSTIHKLQKTFQKIFGFTLPLFHGRGIFNYNLGLMPYRHPIVSVVGKAIEVEQTSNPSQEMLEDVQSRYIDELMRIWDKYKDIYAANRTRELTLVD
ncbi:diacylglycerol acyltransferase [Wallemia mellicola CBS 633.66]|uniref:Diacylglycerol O-acyltransferase n=1 Tax=Wallemia mellicola (strain ATCC MYA-4683 / CBS 633.66) TaxID=671144 RepID=I4YE91_WALMC|nr:diacylglycerol acyltransferase [Wallemia mellicola CBS 633.66]EIM22283.1 diacylglycerol acyltransferase [Wallemia mellicola CBS 633.66]|eukprot:XP_006957543.1 diacylglycerol acyltransferase [Wallemia mellicola CBS 633.66]